MKNAFPEVAVYHTKDERIARRPDGTFTEGYSALSEFETHPGFKLVWEYRERPADSDRSWDRLRYLNSSRSLREEFAKEATALEALWTECLRIQRKGWKLDASHGQRPVELVAGSGNSGSGRDSGTSKYTPDCTAEEAIEEVNSWLECQDNVDRITAVMAGRGRDF